MTSNSIFAGAWSALLLCLLLALPQTAHAQRTLNHGLHAVPAPGPVTIDGDLSEWDTSGAIVLCKDVETLLNSESARVSAMWDDTNLYLAFDWRDATPMMNKVDPATMPGNGWRSDCCQLRLNMNGFVSHIDCWYYTPGKRAAMTIHYGRLDVAGGGQPAVDRPAPEKIGAEQAFRLAADGKGYYQEMKLPWTMVTLDGKRPPLTADLRVGLELFWGDASAESWPRSRVTDNLYDGESQTDFFWTNTKAWGRLMLETHNHLALPAPAWLRAKSAPPQGTVPITFTLPRDSFVSIAVEDAHGNRVKSLLAGEQLGKGTHTIYWSGLNDRNQLMPVGAYHWTGVYHDQLDTRWKMSFYQPNSETPWGNVSGTGAWGPDHGTMRGAAAGDGRVYLAATNVEAGYALFAVDPASGRKLWTAKYCEAERLAFADGQVYAYTGGRSVNFLGLTPNGLMQIDAATGKWLDLPDPAGKPVRRLPLLTTDETLDGFAADKDGIYLAVKEKSLIRQVNRHTFTVQHEYPVPACGELFACGDGRVLIAAANGLYTLNLQSGATQTLTNWQHPTVHAVTADTHGRIYVALAAPEQQILVYQQTGAHAALARTLGKLGGRTQNGWYDPNEGFLTPSGMALDSENRLWVVEDGSKPKRTSVWKDGRWQRDFVGDTGYGGGGVINPLDPSMAFYNGMQFKIDLAKGTYRLTQIGMVLPEGLENYLATKARPGFAGDGDPLALSGDPTEYLTVCKGRAYLMNCRNTLQLYRERKDGRWVLCVYIDPKAKFAWIDRNDDGKIDPAEVVRGGAGDDWGSLDYWGNRPSQNLDLFFGRGVEKSGLRLRLQGMTKGGTPLYDFRKFEPMAGECQNGIGLRDGSYNSGCTGDRGEYFSEMRKIYPAGETKRTFWYRGENTGRWTFRLPEPGLVLYPYQAHGVADVPAFGGEVVCWVSDFGQRYLFTDDMLLIGQLFTDGRATFTDWPDKPQRDFLANDMAPGQESFGGFFARMKDGRYLLTSGFTDCRVFEVTGLDSLRRLRGDTEVKTPDLARAQEIKQFFAVGNSGPVSATLPRMKTPPALDGHLTGWNQDAPVARITVDAQRSARVFAAYNDTQLYVAWDVRDDHPMLNHASRLELAFKGGDAVDLMFRLPGAKPDDAALHLGDLRLLITEFNGKLQAVLYRPLSASKHPYTLDAFESAGRQNAVTMDEVRAAEEVHAVLTREKDGYVIEAAIPWSLLGATPQAGTEGRIDFGVLYGDQTGFQTMLRRYWSNRDTNIVADIPSEARLQPGNWGVCKFGE